MHLMKNIVTIVGWLVTTKGLSDRTKNTSFLSNSSILLHIHVHRMY